MFKEIIGMFRGSDGMLSERRVFALVILVGIIRYVEKPNPSEGVLVTLCGTFLLLLSIITWQNVKEIKSGGNAISGEPNK